MHRWIKFGLGAAGIACLAAGTLVYGKTEPDQPLLAVTPQLVPVIAATVQRNDVPIIVTGLGTVTALNTATIRSQVTGLLISVDFQEGQSVKQGDLLAQIDPRTFQAQLEQAQAALGRDQAHLNNARLNLNRYEPLANQGYASEQQYAGQQSAVAEQENVVKADQAAVDDAQTELSYTSLRAPFDGVTGIKLIDVGNVIHPTDPTGLVVITQIQPITVIFTLPTTDIPAVQEALAKGPVETRVFSEDGKTKLDTGRLLLVNNQADPDSGTVRLKAIFPNQWRQLWPGTFVNVHLVTATRHNGLTIPLAAVQQGPQGQFVFVVGDVRRVSLRPVSTLQSLNGEVLIDKGLSAGETVVVRGQYRLSPGTLVTLANPRDPNAVPNPTTASAGMLP